MSESEKNTDSTNITINYPDARILEIAARKVTAINAALEECQAEIAACTEKFILDSQKVDKELATLDESKFGKSSMPIDATLREYRRRVLNVRQQATQMERKASMLSILSAYHDKVDLAVKDHIRAMAHYWKEKEQAK